MRGYGKLYIYTISAITTLLLCLFSAYKLPAASSAVLNKKIKSAIVN